MALNTSQKPVYMNEADKQYLLIHLCSVRNVEHDKFAKGGKRGVLWLRLCCARLINRSHIPIFMRTSFTNSLSHCCRYSPCFIRNFYVYAPALYTTVSKPEYA